MQTLTRVDDVLARHGIDTTSCMQRAVCTYTQQAAVTVGEEDERSSSFDKLVNTVTTNQMFRTAMQGTAVQEAVEAGRSGGDCSKSYPHCGFSMEAMLSLLSNVVAVTNVVPTGASSSL